MNEIVSIEMHCLYFLKFYLRELNCIVSSIKSLLAITENGGSRSVRWMQRFVASSRCYIGLPISGDSGLKRAFIS